MYGETQAANIKINFTASPKLSLRILFMFKQTGNS